VRSKWIRKIAVMITVISIIIVTVSATHAQQPSISISSDSTGKSRTFLAGNIQISQDVAAALHAFDGSIFTCTLVHPLVKGQIIAAIVSEDQGWSIEKTPSGYPIQGMVKSSNGEFHSLFPAILKAKIDIKPGAVLHSGNYNIETNQFVKAGDSIPVFLVGKRAILSIKAAEGAGNGSKIQPLLMVFASDAKPDERRAAVEAWQIEKKHVSQ
jgi:hypothetical protein